MVWKWMKKLLRLKTKSSDRRSSAFYNRPNLEMQQLGTIEGQCMGDALGLLTEFMTKEEATAHYGKEPKDLNYEQKVEDSHRCQWEVGDWTDDTDQMILIFQSLLFKKGELDPVDFAKRLRYWEQRGFPELGDKRGVGIGENTAKVLGHFEFLHDPHKAAEKVWKESECFSAPNGAVMRTSILGLHQWQDLEAVKNNALAFCKVTHYDPRCQASVVAVATCIALMLQDTQRRIDLPDPYKSRPLDMDDLIRQSYDAACTVLDTQEQKNELWKYMSCTKIEELQLDEEGKIGYTYKCLGAGFWALKQDNFKTALITVVMEAGDADTNACVAGALLGCRLGRRKIHTHCAWGKNLLHYRNVIKPLFERFLTLQSQMVLPVEERDDNTDMEVGYTKEKADATTA